MVVSELWQLTGRKPKFFSETELHWMNDNERNEFKRQSEVIFHESDVTVYDNGFHENPIVFKEPFVADLWFVSGVLLNGFDGGLDSDILKEDDFQTAYNDRYNSRLYNTFVSINSDNENTHTVTMPALGCGCFANVDLRKHIKSNFKAMILNFFSSHTFLNIQSVFVDLYDESDKFEMYRFENMNVVFHNSKYSKIGQFDFVDNSASMKHSIVAWDMVSYPGNDFWTNHRQTDDGVKAAATNVMSKMTGCEGYYDRKKFKYLPKDYRLWQDCLKSPTK